MFTMFGQMKLSELKVELRKRGAKTTGRKSELIERLEAYDRNHNFENESNECEAPIMQLPSPSKYRDLTSDSPMPLLMPDTRKAFLNQFSIVEVPESAIQMYHNGYLTFVRSCISEKGTYIRAVCKAEMRKHVTYNVELLVNTNFEILESQCDCAAGKGLLACCKHIITLLIGIEDFGQRKEIKIAPSKTECLQSFHTPSKKYFGNPVKAEELPLKRFKLDGTESSFLSSNICFDPRPVKFRNNAGYNDFVQSVCINYAIGNDSFPLLQLYAPANMHGVEHDHDYFKKSLSELCLEKLNIEGNVDKDYIIDLELKTRLQSKSKIWMEERVLRITSSNFGTICKATGKRDLENLASSLVNPSILNTKPILHGQQYETTAIAQYEEVTSKTVRKCGLFVYQEKPFLAASPDGLLDDTGLLEAKCPYTARDKRITPENVPYLEIVDEELRLKENHYYYYQIQGQLLIAKKNYCDLVIYTFKDFVIITIERNDNFINSMINSLEGFYNSYYKAALKSKYFYLQK